MPFVTIRTCTENARGHKLLAKHYDKYSDLLTHYSIHEDYEKAQHCAKKLEDLRCRAAGAFMYLTKHCHVEEEVA